MSSQRVFCLVVTWTTASVTNFTLSIGDCGADPSGSSAVNSSFSHVPLFPLLVCALKSKGCSTINSEKIATICITKALWKARLH